MPLTRYNEVRRRRRRISSSDSPKLITAVDRDRWQWSRYTICPPKKQKKKKRAEHDERGYRGHGEVLRPGQRPWPAGDEALRGGRAGVRLPCLLLRVDSEWEGSVLWAVLYQVTPHLVCTSRWPSTTVFCFLMTALAKRIRLCSYVHSLAREPPVT